jgi:outer membrane protein assembly factor BamB
MRKIGTIKTVIFLLFSGWMLFYSCKEMPQAEEFDPSNTRLHVVWSKPFYADSSQIVALPPIVADRYVAVLGRSFSKSENHIVVFDKTNGERHPAWLNGARCGTTNAKDFLLGGNNKDILFCATYQSIHAFSIPTGKSLWNFELDGHILDNMGRPSILGADILVISLASSTQHIERYNSATGQKTNLFSFNEYINTIQWTVNERNDTLLFFFSGWNSAYCYNLTQNNIVWKCDNVKSEDYGEETSFHPIIVENKYVLFQSEYYISCLDFSTGNLIWEQRTTFADHCPIFYCEGKVIVRTNYDYVSCYDVKTGNLLWKNTNLRLLDDINLKMDAYKGNLYFITRRGTTYDCPGFLHCISLETGALNWFDPGPDKGIYENLTIDQQTGYLYCSSRWSVMCIDLNKTATK